MFDNIQTVIARFLDIDHVLSMCVQIPKQETLKTAEANINNIIYLKHILELVDPLRNALSNCENRLMKHFYKVFLPFNVYGAIVSLYFNSKSHLILDKYSHLNEKKLVHIFTGTIISFHAHVQCLKIDVIFYYIYFQLSRINLVNIHVMPSVVG